LGAAGEVEPAEHRRALEGVDRERRRDELREVPLHARELEGELVNLLPGLAVALAGQALERLGVDLLAEDLELLVEDLARVGLVHVELERRAPRLLAVGLAHVAEELV